ncbi:glycosyltransferase family 39 protein [Synechococcus sp. PCC 7336]|uniref:ArnT family glycosyltransferase n=1 Tax=Synechococcus sp. PCC 7336 TaxID=195250 RepID=UPI000348A412|nr:glycosyltransferase family 39 protein [Synechococcus sp. PCC 7336]
MLPILTLLALGLCVRIAIAILLPPGFDEAYYYAYTLHPNWSYFDHPPLVAIATGFGPWLTGSVTRWSIRLGPLLLHTGSLLWLTLATRHLFGRTAALLALAIASVIPIFQVGFGTLALPDSPLVFFWSLCLYCAAREFFDRDRPYRPSWQLSAVSLLVGLACLGKYHGLALGFGLVCFCLLSDRHRSALRSPWTLLGCGLFAIALAPIAIWNAQHQWASFLFQSSRAIPTTGYRFDSLAVTGLVGIAYLFPTLGLPMWWAIARGSWVSLAARWGRWQGQAEIPDKYLLLLCVSLPIAIGFTGMGGYRAILPTWPMPGFWGIVPLLGHLASQWRSPSPALVWRWLAGSGLTASLLMLLATLHVRAGIFQIPSTQAVLGGIIPVETDASTQLLDIEQLRRSIEQSPDLIEALNESGFVFTNNWFASGQVAMAIAPLSPIPITCFSSDPRGFAFWSEPAQWLHRNGVYVALDYSANPDRNPEAPYRPYFQSVDAIGRISMVRGGTETAIARFYRMDDLIQPYPWPD